MITDEDVLKYFCGNNLKNIQWRKLENISDDLLNYLNNRYNDSESIRETIIRIKLNIDKHPLCPHCGKPVLLHNIRPFFLSTCGNKECSKVLAKEKYEKTMMEKYGYKYNFQNKETNKKCIKNSHSPEALRKALETSKNKWGEGNYRNRNKAKQTCLEKYGVEFYFNREKAKQTKLERYGDENYVNVKLSKQTKLERYGDENYTNKEKAKRTCLEKYGVEYLTQDKNFQEKIHKKLKEKYGCVFNMDKCKETWIEKYGVDNPWKAEEVKEKIKETCKEKYGSDSWSSSEEGRKRISEFGLDKEIQLKKYNTFKKNKSFNRSNEELICYELLKEKYPDIIKQYRSEEYPFNCDFYIPSLNLYIEYNGSQYHHFHPFDENNPNDINELNRLKELEKKKLETCKETQYTQIIYTWTDLDVRKRNMVKENNLNFIEFWSIDELKDWLKDK